MTVAIKMRGELEPELLAGSFSDFANAMNLAALGPKAYVIAQDTQGRNVALRESSILTIRDLGDDDD